MDESKEMKRGAGPVDFRVDVGEADGRERMAARIGVKGDFIRVPQLARIIGISSTSIHAQMRSGTFPIPHRRVGNVIVVKLDDYIEWFRSDGSGGRASRRSVGDDRPPSESGDFARDPAEPAIQRVAPPPSRETAAEFKARLALKVRAAMRRKGFDG